MELPVVLNNSRQTASVVFAGRDDFAFVNDWRKTLNEDQNPVRVAALEFTQLAISRFQAHSEIQAYAKSIDDIADHIVDNPLCEIANIVLLTCNWFPESGVIGVCHFRRTWSNGIILDYLATHPFIVRPPKDYPYKVNGVGLALLYFISLVAKRYECQTIWGEATQSSCGYYKKVLKLDSVKDLIYAPRENFIKLIAELDEKWAKSTGAVTNKDIALTEVYDLEASNPPFVGSLTAVFSPQRRLAYRFLELPYHEQRRISASLGLFQEEDRNQPFDEQFRRIFRRATESKKLSDLWRAVEGQYPDGKPDNNPFSYGPDEEGRSDA